MIVITEEEKTPERKVNMRKPSMLITPKKFSKKNGSNGNSTRNDGSTRGGATTTDQLVRSFKDEDDDWHHISHTRDVSPFVPVAAASLEHSN